MFPTIIGKEKMLLLLDYYTTRKVSFFHATFTTISLLSLKQILFLLRLSLRNTGHYQLSFTTNNAASLAEHIPSAPFKAATPWGGHGDFTPLEFNTGVVRKAEFVTRKSGINCLCITGNNFTYLNNFMLLIILC